MITLTPPNLDQSHIKEHITCVRPKRRGGPRIETVRFGDKLIIHNYGHGGFGWSMLPGSVQHSLLLFEKEATQISSKNVTVIGAGCMGLLTAVLLKEHGYEPTIIAEELTYLTSHKAAGSYAVISVKAKGDKQALMDQLMVNSYLFYKELVASQKPLFTGVRGIPVYMIHEGRPNYRFPIVEAGVMNKPEELEVSFGKTKTYRARKFDTFYVHTNVVMQSIMDRISEYKIPIIKKKVTSFSQIETDIIFNCSGFGARLWEPENMIPVQGHLVRMKNQPPETQDYILYAHIRIDGKLREVSWTPNGEGSLGGTSINCQDSIEPNPERSARILERARLFFGDTR